MTRGLVRIGAPALLMAGLFATAHAAVPPPAPLPAASAPPASGAGASATPGRLPLVAAPSLPVLSEPSPVPPTAQAPVSAVPADANVAASEAEQAAVQRVVPVADATAAASDHDAVVGAWGIEVRPVAATLPVFARRASTGCPTAPAAVPGAPVTTVDCPAISVGMLGVRHWLGSNLAVDAGIALAMGGGSDSGRLLDSYFGFGPAVGLAVLLGNWRHLAVMASPSVQMVVFKGAGSADTTYVADLRADLEGELHFGFIGVPALSLGIRSGVLLRLEHAADVSLWSAGVAGATTVRGLVSDLSLRYYF
jgi:hypothetical protein